MQQQREQPPSLSQNKFLPPIQYPKPSIACEQSAVIWTILNAIEEISYTLRHSPVIVLESQNKFGDTQLHQDVHCDEIVEKHLLKNSQIKGFASEERPQLKTINDAEETQLQYIITYDPIDGSSIIDTNFTVGSIFSIWPKTEKQLIGQKLSQQKNAILALYGPRTTVMFWNRTVNKVQELTLIDKQWVLSHEHLTIKPKTKLFSPGNLRAIEDNAKYSQIVQGWIQNQYTLRYTGGMVPDVAQIFIKGHGIFSNIQSQKHKAKLRVLYEAAAVGFLVDKAEGATMTKGKISLLDYEIQTYDDRISFACGSSEEVKKFKSLFQ